MTPNTDGDGKSGPAEVGKSAPDLKVDTVNGKGSISIDSLQGKVAIVDFWATWCGPCKQSFPKLEELSKQNDKIVVVGISVDDKADGVADFAKANGATFPIGWDDGHTIAGRWKVDTMPTTYILDATGKVRYVHAGYKDGEAQDIQKELASLSSESGSSGSANAKSDSSTTTAAATPTPAPADTATTATTDATATASTDPPAKPAKKKKKKPAKKPPAGTTPAATPPASN